MRERLSILFALAAAGWASGSLAHGGPARPQTPAPFVGALDGTAVAIENPVDGTAWSAWAWRTGGEFDLAVSFRGADGAWSRPVFLSSNDGADQLEPAFARDGFGNLYLAFAERPSNRIYLSVLASGATAWSTPLAVTPVGVPASSPALEIVGRSLVLAYRSEGGISIQVLETVGTQVMDPLGVQDGPDPVGPSGAPSQAPADEGSSVGGTPLGAP